MKFSDRMAARVKQKWVIVALALGAVSASPASAPAAPLNIQIHPVGVAEVEARAYEAAVMGTPRIRERFGITRHRVLHAAFGADALMADSKAILKNPFPFRIAVYDYSFDQHWLIEGDLSDETGWEILRSSERLEPSPEEITEARELIRQDERFRSFATQIEIEPAMPALVDELSRPRERIIALQVWPSEGTGLNPEVVGVNLSRREVMHYAAGAPPTSCADRATCGYANAVQGVVPRGTPGQADITVDRDGLGLWKMRAVRPSSSSGRWGSGIDLRNIYYRGRKVLSQLHVPIANVLYDFNRCGPYRDWQFSEGAFEAIGSDAASGFRQTTQPARTIMDSGQDQGNFWGVAVYAEGEEAVLVTEVEAGWYRYKVEYRFHEDGTIRPRWGFSAVRDSCTCFSHTHHMYWRMDFDLGESNKNHVQVFDGAQWMESKVEERQYRDKTHLAWRVWNEARDFGYEVFPGEHDGSAIDDSFARGDVWLLKHTPQQTDDSQVFFGAPANLGAFLNREALEGEDVVFWYGAHYRHAHRDGRDGNFVVGPEIRPIK